MITRRRGRCQAELSCLDVAVVDAVETLEDVPSPEELPAIVTDLAGPDLGSLFRTEDLEWNPAFPLFDTELEDLCTYIAKDQSSEGEASPGASKRKLSSDLKMKNIQNHSKQVINKNAIAARINRLKKKEYVTNLEKKVSIMSAENNTLKQENCHLTKRVEELEDETRYLRAVLANESMLAQLLSRLSGMNGMKLSSSLFQGSDPNDHDYALPCKRVKVEEKETSGGVCLHVDKNHVSVEFCTKCAESASTSLKM